MKNPPSPPTGTTNDSQEPPHTTPNPSNLFPSSRPRAHGSRLYPSVSEASSLQSSSVGRTAAERNNQEEASPAALSNASTRLFVPAAAAVAASANNNNNSLLFESRNPPSAAHTISHRKAPPAPATVSSSTRLMTATTTTMMMDMDNTNDHLTSAPVPLFGRKSKSSVLEEDDGDDDANNNNHNYDNFARAARLPPPSVASSSTTTTITQPSSSILHQKRNGSYGDDHPLMTTTLSVSSSSSQNGKMPAVEQQRQQLAVKTGNDDDVDSDGSMQIPHHLRHQDDSMTEIVNRMEQEKNGEDDLQRAIAASQEELEHNNGIVNNNNDEEEHLLQQALAASKQESESKLQLELDELERALAMSQRDATMVLKHPPDDLDFSSMDMELMKEHARMVRTLCGNVNIDADLLDFALSECREDLKILQASMQIADDDAHDVGLLLDLNGIVLNAVELGTHMTKSVTKPAAAAHTDQANVATLVEQRAIFALIDCMLKKQSDRRLDAALALCYFARQAEHVGDDESVALRDEIRSLGGLHSLLALFRARNTPYELKVVVSLAMAYVLPSFVMSSATKPRVGLKIMEALRFLSQARDVTPREERITRSECLQAAAMGLTTFWIHQLEPMLHVEIGGSQAASEETSLPLVSFARTLSTGSRRSQGRGGGGDVFDRRQESIEVQELLEMTVSLIIYVAEHCERQDLMLGGNPILLIEQVCAVESARPIAVREGVLKILVRWTGSEDPEKIRPAASALRYLTSINDKYMAGWIHSQMVNEGALPGVISLTRDATLSHDVRLAIAQIISSLCVAPHTRAAVVEANGVHFLIDILYDSSDSASDDVALFAARALLQLAAGAITRASVFVGEDRELTSFVSADKRDTLIEYIVARGSIASFVAIARSRNDNLRSVAVEALRVISEDTSPNRQTRLNLVESGAASALGNAMKTLIERISNGSSFDGIGLTRADVKELHESLCAFGNMLDAGLDRQADSPSTYARSDSNNLDVNELLTQGCVQAAESGGLESLLWIASLHVNTESPINPLDSHLVLVDEACRSLSLLSPYLLTPSVARQGYTSWANDIFGVLHNLLRQVIDKGDQAEAPSSLIDIQISAFHGIGALAKSSALQIKIVDKVLPFIVQMRGSEQTDLSAAAGRAFQSLEFAEDEVATQVAGNNPNMLADWYVLQRSLLIQAMARTEIRAYVKALWDDTSSVLSDNSHGREVFSEASSEDPYTTQCMTEVMRQYSEVYSPKGRQAESVRQPSVTNDEDSGLLARHCFPLNSTQTEARWILDHCSSVDKTNIETNAQLPLHVKQLLEACFPSKLLSDRIVPVHRFSLASLYDFRALLMPRKRYLSFRRESQLLSRICAREASLMGSGETHWTLGFTNSSFAGEFSESLVQALYLCPMIRGLSFSRNEKWAYFCQNDKEYVKDDGAGALLANLSGSLPPWIAYLTFEGVLVEHDLRVLVSILHTIGKLASARELESSVRHLAVTEEEADGPSAAHIQGRFSFFAIRRSPQISSETWTYFFGLLGRGRRDIRGPSSLPLSCLKSLDLSWNELGDETCASVLELCHDKDSKCRLEELDLSGNRIMSAEATLKVLSGYVQYYRREQVSGRKSPHGGWVSSLQVLRLASNGLDSRKAWLEIVALLKNNALDLKELDLSCNNLTIDEGDYDAEVFLSSLNKNTTLCSLDLANNCFSSVGVDLILSRMLGTENNSGLAFLSLSGNSPNLTDQQECILESFCARSRKTLLRRFDSKEQQDSTVGMQLSGQEHLYETSLREKDGGNTITVLFSAPLAFFDTENVLQPFAKLDFHMERELLWQCLKEASRDIQISFDSATHNRLLAAVTRRCSCLHYSGHGHPEYLAFEDGYGGPHWLNIQEIRSLIEAREGGVPFKFVFVSACYSEQAGETFAMAGVPHVVCCQQECELKDAAALAFTRQFYLALAVGHTVKDSFDQGCKAVRLHPNLQNADSEMGKFILLPRDGNHDVPIFDAKPVMEWPLVPGRTQRSGYVRSRQPSLLSFTSNTNENNVRNMMQDDPSPSPPQFFAAREIDMYHVLRAILGKRLVSVVGEVGIGRSSLVNAVCHYINERASTITVIRRIIYLRVVQSRKTNLVHRLARKLMKKLVEAGLMAPPHAGADTETIVDAICKSLKSEKALLVFDRTEQLEDADEANEFPMLLSSLFRETRNVRILLTARQPLGIPSLGGQVEHSHQMGPLNFGDTIRLFANLCPYLQTQAERRKLFETLAADVDGLELLPTDPGLSALIRKIFSKIGNGVPSRIEKAAYLIPKDDFLSLKTGSIRNEL